MKNYGVTETGFVRKTFDEIREDLGTSLIETYGPLDLTDESWVGNFRDIFSEDVSLLWYGLEGLNNANSPDTATGIALDNIASINNIVRQEATATTVIAQISGVNQTLIPENSQASAIGVPTFFNLRQDTVITNLSCLKVQIDITNIVEPSYIVVINSTNITYMLQVDDTKTIIVDGLVNMINVADVGVTASNVGDILHIESDDLTELFSVYIQDGLTILEITTNADFVAVDKGFIPLPAETLTTIQTPISGWNSITNAESGLTGRNRETDTELRLRRKESVRLGGAGTVEAIRSRLLNVPGVTAVSITENTSLVDVDGMPGKSFQALVLGGDDQDIGDTIWKAKPAGIRAFGNVDVTVVDSTDKEQLVQFSRPVNLYIYVNVEITEDDSNMFPVNGVEVITENIASQINLLNVNEDVIYQSLYKSVYSVQGVQSATITIGGTLVELTVPALASSNVTVGVAQIAVTDNSKITVNVT